MEKITKLSFFDFDATLFDSPMPDSGKLEYKEKTGQEYPHIGWWGREESLDTNIFDIKIFPNVASKLNNDHNQDNAFVAILTSRIGKLKPQIKNLLKINNIQVDEISTKDNNKEKDVRIKEYLVKYPDTQTIDVYDDREKEFNVFLKLKRDLKLSHPHIQLNIFKVDNDNISKLGS